MPTAEKETKETVVAPFAVEIDHHTNSDVIIQCIPGCKLRSAIRPRPVLDRKSGNMMIPPDQASTLGRLPPIPGMQLHVNPSKLSYAIVDPLADDEQLCERIRQQLRATSGIRTSDRIRGVETKKGKLDIHRMKTLVREVRWLLESGDAKEVQGKVPEMDEIEELPGRFLLNPGSRIPNSQPKFEDQYEQWVENLTKVGG